MANVWTCQGSDSIAEAIRRAATALAEGQIVAVPTETVYGLAANALDPRAVERLQRAKGRPEDKPLTLALAHPDTVLDWVPGLNGIGRRLVRRCWPGPVTMVFDEGLELGLLQRLPPQVRSAVSPNGSLGLRVPAHDVATKLLERWPGPLVLSSANRSGEPEATSAQQIANEFGEGVAVVLDAGAPRYGQASTVIRVKGNQFDVLREGVLPAEALRRLAARVILFVCTGNTCRSPLAEGLCKKLLAESLQCKPEELPERGFVVLSAGISAASGYPASPEGAITAEQRGVDLSTHQSRLLSRHLLAQADDVFAMTHSHLRALRTLGVADGGRQQVLSPEGIDLADPIGCEQARYDDCADQIATWLRQRLPSLLT